MGSYSELEEKIVNEHVHRVKSQLSHECDSITAIGFDWSTWDDTYTFIEDRNEEYIDTNLQYEIFKDIKINFMFFYNTSEYLIFNRSFDLNQGKEITLPASLNTLINENKNLLLNHPNGNYSISGIIVFDYNETPLLVSSTPIMKSNKTGMIRGTLLIGRILDKEKLDYFKNITQLSLSIHPLERYSSLFLNDDSSTNKANQISIRPFNDTYIAGYSVFLDVFGAPSLIIEVGSDRDIYNQGFIVLQNIFISLLFTTIFLVIVTIIILDKFVTSRLTIFSKSVSGIQNFKDLSRHIEINGNDEISQLGRNINVMLSSLQNTWAMKDSAEFSLKKKIEELEQFKTITVDREIKMIELKKQIEELKTKVGREA